MKKCKTIRCWQDKVWKKFSQYIKLRDCQESYFICISCHEQKPIEQYQAGHYIHGKTPGTWLNQKNVHAQCVGCNKFRNGNLPAYALELERRYGEGVLQELDKLKHSSRQTYTIGMLKEEFERIDTLRPESLNALCQK